MNTIWINQFNIIVATLGDTNIIGQKTYDGNFILPWPKCVKDMIFFKNTTTGSGNNAVIMGHNTWMSLPDNVASQGQPSNTFLKNRINIIISRNSEDFFPKDKNVHVEKTLRAALNWCYDTEIIDEIFVIGGGKIYKECFENQFIHEIKQIYQTKIFDTNCISENAENIHFPIIPQKYFRCIQTYCLNPENNNPINVYTWELHNSEEEKYLDLLNYLINHGVETDDRTGVGTLSSFGKFLEFDLSDNRIPVLTTKQVFIRGSIEEMLFFLSGKTDATLLSQKGIHIWDANTSRAYLDSVGLSNYEEGDLGVGYSFCFRHFGAEEQYTGKDGNYDGMGCDQVARLIEGIKTNPNSRRHMITLWNPAYIHKMSLPPCLGTYLFHVNSKDNSLSLMAIMRSTDMFLGCPFNITGASLLLIMVAHLTEKLPGKLMLVMNNCHLYLNHIYQAKKQIENKPRLFPILTFRRSSEEIGKMENFQTNDFIVKHYHPYPKIQAEMAV